MKSNRPAMCVKWVMAVVLTVSGIPASPAQTSAGAQQTPPPSGPPQEKPSTTIPIVMTMEAGANYWKPYPGAEKTFHVGIGHFSPFGEASYSCGMGFPEQKTLPQPDYITPTWQETFGTRLFCVYTLPQGKIYAWDGVAGHLLDPKTSNGKKSDYLINVVVGGTGLFEGAAGIWLGTTIGAGELKEIAAKPAKEGDPKETLPEVLIKSMQGYIKLPGMVKEYQPTELRNATPKD